PFYTDMRSLFGEYQWRMSDTWTMFLGGRYDWHNYLPDHMFSPRAALVWTPNEKDTIKMMWTKSNRVGNDSTLREGYLLNQADSSVSDHTDVETIETYELRYERQHTKRLWLASSLFYNIHNPVGWSGSTTTKEAILGEMRSIGFELEAAYHTDRLRVIFSHGYTKLVGYSQGKTVQWTALTAAGQEYGMDFAGWDNHVSKLRVEYDLTEKWSVDGSLQVLWGSPGKSDFVDWRREVLGLQDDHIYRGGIFLNLGLQCKANENLLVRFDAYNVLGFIDKDYNAYKVLSDGDTAANGGTLQQQEYITASPAFGVSATYKF
ncbi:MAG: TonB-dependent receptor, partial [Phycisphaerae bacterium]|nr:TonB-dependent receptor [Phycisphaerae bacterium]